MKNRIVICLSLVLLLTACRWGGNDGLPGDGDVKYPVVKDYYWYYNKELFENADSCYVVGVLESRSNDEKYQVNHQCKIYNDTIYIVKKFTKNNIFKGVIYLKDKEPFTLNTELQ